MSSGKTCKFIDEITCPRNRKKKKKSKGQNETKPALVSFATGRDGSEG